MAIGNLTDFRKSVWYGGNYVVEWFQAGDSSMYAGYVAMDDDADEVKVCAVDGVPFAVMGDLPTIALATAFTAGIAVYGFLIGSGAKVMVGHDTDANTAAKGQLCLRSAAIAGLVEAGTTAGVTVGRYQETLAVAADQWIKCLI